MAEAAFTIGVDAGATRCRARLRAAGGALLAAAEAGPANIHVDFATAAAVLQGVVAEVLGKAGLNDSDRPRVALGLGLAGLNDAADAARIAGAFPGFARVRAVNDASAACVGAHAGADGGLVIAGTGSAAIARVKGVETIVGGRGFTLGDDGSGARIGLAALRATTLALDGIEPHSALTRELATAFAEDAVALVRWARAATPGDFGAYAPSVFVHAQAGDPVARPIVREAARAVDALARRTVALGAEQVALVGGVGDALRPYMDRKTEAALIHPLHDAVDGAILVAGGNVARPG